MELRDLLINVWPEWKIESVLGRGSYGYVYKAVKNYHNIETRSAIKVIAIPQTEAELEELSSEGMTMEQTRTYYQEVVDEIVNEIVMMESLKSVYNVVKIEDYKVCERKDSFGWDIYIRMELLTPLNAYLCDKKLSEQEVIKLGEDICSALTICNKKDIIHRDIKPENIFVNEFGDFKLGDFGIARKLENLTFGLSQKGTFNYMAPEMATSSFYDRTVDIYSLGVVLYKLLNGNRLPFLDASKQLLSPFERKQAVEMRLKGDDLTPPRDASPETAAVVLKACAYLPEKRYQAAEEMKKALLNIGNFKTEVSGECFTSTAEKTFAEIQKDIKEETSEKLYEEVPENVYEEVAGKANEDVSEKTYEEVSTVISEESAVAVPTTNKPIKERKKPKTEKILLAVSVVLGAYIIGLIIYLVFSILSTPSFGKKENTTADEQVQNETVEQVWNYSWDDGDHLYYQMEDLKYPEGYFISERFKKCNEAYQKAVELVEAGEFSEAGEYLRVVVNDPIFLYAHYGNPSLSIDKDLGDGSGYFCHNTESYKTVLYWDDSIPRVETTLYYLTEESEEPEFFMFWHANADNTILHSLIYTMDGQWIKNWSRSDEND